MLNPLVFVVIEEVWTKHGWVAPGFQALNISQLKIQKMEELRRGAGKMEYPRIILGPAYVAEKTKSQPPFLARVIVFDH